MRDLAERLQRAARVEVELLRVRRRRLAEGERVGDDERAAVVDVDLAGRGTRLVAQDDVLRRERAAVDDDAVGDVHIRRHRLVAHVVGAPAVERAAVQRQRGRRRMDIRSVVAHVDLRHAEGSAVDRQLRLKSLRRRGRGHAAVEREVEGRSAVERAVVHHDLARGLHRAFRHGRTLTDRESIGERHHRRVIVVPDRADHHAAFAHDQVLESRRRSVAVRLHAVRGVVCAFRGVVLVADVERAAPLQNQVARALLHERAHARRHVEERQVVVRPQHARVARAGVDVEPGGRCVGTRVVERARTEDQPPGIRRRKRDVGDRREAAARRERAGEARERVAEHHRAAAGVVPASVGTTRSREVSNPPGSSCPTAVTVSASVATSPSVATPNE